MVMTFAVVHPDEWRNYLAHECRHCGRWYRCNRSICLVMVMPNKLKWEMRSILTYFQEEMSWVVQYAR